MALTFAKPALLLFGGTPTSDHNRDAFPTQPEFIKNDIRTANGSLRRSTVAVKNTYSVSWGELPYKDIETVDGFMGAESLIAFISANTGSFTLGVVEYDNTTTNYTVMFDSFDWELVKRWDTHYYNISVDLVEV